MYDRPSPYEQAQNMKASIDSARDVDRLRLEGSADQSTVYLYVEDGNRSTLEDVKDQFVPRRHTGEITTIATRPTLVVTISEQTVNI